MFIILGIIVFLWWHQWHREHRQEHREHREHRHRRDFMPWPTTWTWQQRWKWNRYYYHPGIGWYASPFKIDSLTWIHG